MSVIPIATLFCLSASHGPLGFRLAKKVRRSGIPTSRDLVIASFLIFYDFGIMLETAGVPYRNSAADFRPLFAAPDADAAIALIILIVSPWIIDFGAGAFTTRVQDKCQHDVCLARSARPSFYVGASLVCLFCVCLAIHFELGSEFVWSLRATTSEVLGPYILILSFPLFILVFYIQTRDSHSRLGLAYTVCLAVCSVISAIPSGERNAVLLPIISIVLFRKKPSLRGLFITGIAGVLGASLLLPIFKAQGQYNDSNSDLILRTLNDDLSRSPILVDVVSHSRLFGTQVLDYPSAGYVYSALLYLPRSVAPFKGNSTSIVYTAHVVNTLPSEMDWGLGISAIDELLLNFGILILPIGLIMYGFGLRIADQLSQRIPVLVAPTRLAAIFVLGYHLPAIIAVYGTMALAEIILFRLFAIPSSASNVRFAR